MIVRFRNRSLALRIISALIALPIALVPLWLGGWALYAAAVSVIIITALELRRILRCLNYRPLTGMSILMTSLLLFATLWPAERPIFFLLWGVIAAVTLLTLRAAPRDFLATFLLPLYIGLPLSALVILRQHGLWWVLTALIGTWAFDSGAFFIGRSYGKRKLAPRISPNKTWEGFAGGMVITILVVLLCSTKLSGVTWYSAGMLGVVIGIAATYGDLAESALKRQAKIKDSSHIMPGHGGLLDRIDSLLFSLIAVYVFVALFSK